MPFAGGGGPVSGVDPRTKSLLEILKQMQIPMGAAGQYRMDNPFGGESGGFTMQGYNPAAPRFTFKK